MAAGSRSLRVALATMVVALLLLLLPAASTVVGAQRTEPAFTPPALVEPAAQPAAAQPTVESPSAEPPASAQPPAEPPTARTVPVSEDEVVRGDPDRPNAALVVNVGAGYEPAVAMLDTLREKGVRTTFFVLGWWAEQRPDLLKRIADDGHEIASHGHSVFDLTSVSDAEVRADLERADAAISAVTGRTTRPLWSPSAGYRDQRVHRIAASLGYRPIYWTIDSGDWTEDATAERVYQRVMTRIENGAIVVLHFDSPTTTASTAVVLPRLIDDLRAAGYSLVTVTDLLTAP